MNHLEIPVFISLFKEACKKCFGFPLAAPLTEPDSKLLANKIFDQTGLVIGAKSLKNYSIFVLSGGKRSLHGNPSVSTLDTLARYVLDAPYTDEVKRKENESHYPYWFQYRSRFAANFHSPDKFLAALKRSASLYIFGLVIIAGLYIIKTVSEEEENLNFTDNFRSVASDSLAERGWIVRSVDTTWWNRRNTWPGQMTLFTLRGDNWPLGENVAEIKDLLMRQVDPACFTVELHFKGFIPERNWQQAGILLSEDSLLKGKMIRLSLSYNDFFGGYSKPPEIIIQAISSSESGSTSKPEEIAHLTLFSLEPGNIALAKNNLSRSALKIEKKGNHYRFLYNNGPGESFSFREVTDGDFNFQPRYVSIFAIQGWADDQNFLPVHIDSFSLAKIDCSKRGAR